MKSKLTITVASILSVLVLVGVGFAAWVISNPGVEEYAQSSITAETVDDKSYSLVATIAENEKIIFGAPAQMTAQNPWLTAGTGTQTEDLEATLTLTLTYKDWEYVPTEFSVTMNAKNGENVDTVFTSLRDGSTDGISGIVKDPTISYKDASNHDTVITPATVKMNGGETNVVKVKKEAFAQSSSNSTKKETDEKTATLVITITFGWGEHFKDVEANVIVNPYVYYNKKAYKDFHEEANKVLTALHGLNGVSYVVTISGKTNTNVSGT